MNFTKNEYRNVHFILVSSSGVERYGDDSVARRSGEESDDGGSDGGDWMAVFVAGVFVAVSGGGRSADLVRTRGQEDEEREEIQGIVRQREAEEGEEDRADQGQGRGPQVHPLAPPFQAHLMLFFVVLCLLMMN